ncbi:MAG: hypothetical protein L0Z53_22310, partial [Acidobacteriales bacterium]|nr:hypothetical protein [Terriglobales bacterium]
VLLEILGGAGVHFEEFRCETALARLVRDLPCEAFRGAGLAAVQEQERLGRRDPRLRGGLFLFAGEETCEETI